MVQPSVKSKSKSETVNGSGQGVSWQMCAQSYISVMALVFQKWSLTHRLNVHQGVKSRSRSVMVNGCVNEVSLDYRPRSLRNRAKPTD